MAREIASASADFARATQIDSQSPDGYIELGVLAATQNDAVRARQSFDRALALGANDARVFAARGRVLADQARRRPG
ncbi:MAG: hypothetical protein U0Z44_14690 [Kouleothrix sp.]